MNELGLINCAATMVGRPSTGQHHGPHVDFLQIVELVMLGALTGPDWLLVFEEDSI
jgi:hypothetical protein